MSPFAIRGIEKEEIFTALESAILVAYKKEKFSGEEKEEELEATLLLSWIEKLGNSN